MARLSTPHQTLPPSHNDNYGRERDRKKTNETCQTGCCGASIMMSFFRCSSMDALTARLICIPVWGIIVFRTLCLYGILCDVAIARKICATGKHICPVNTKQVNYKYVQNKSCLLWAKHNDASCLPLAGVKYTSCFALGRYQLQVLFALGTHKYLSRHPIQTIVALGRYQLQVLFTLGTRKYLSRHQIQTIVALGRYQLQVLFALGTHKYLSRHPIQTIVALGRYQLQVLFALGTRKYLSRCPIQTIVALSTC